MTDASIHSEACPWDHFVPPTIIKRTVVYQQQADPIWPTALSKWCILPRRFHSAWTWTTVTASWHPTVTIYLLIMAHSNPCLPCTIVAITATLDSHLCHHHRAWLHRPIHPCCLQSDSHSHRNSSNSQDTTPCLLAHLDRCLDTTLAATALTWCLRIWQPQQTSATDHLPRFIHTWSLKSACTINA